MVVYLTQVSTSSTHAGTNVGITYYKDVVAVKHRGDDPHMVQGVHVTEQLVLRPAHSVDSEDAHQAEARECDESPQYAHLQVRA